YTPARSKGGVSVEYRSGAAFLLGQFRKARCGTKIRTENVVRQGWSANTGWAGTPPPQSLVHVVHDPCQSRKPAELDGTRMGHGDAGLAAAKLCGAVRCHPRHALWCCLPLVRAKARSGGDCSALRRLRQNGEWICDSGPASLESAARSNACGTLGRRGSPGGAQGKARSRGGQPCRQHLSP